MRRFFKLIQLYRIERKVGYSKLSSIKTAYQYSSEIESHYRQIEKENKIGWRYFLRNLYQEWKFKRVQRDLEDNIQVDDMNKIRSGIIQNKIQTLKQAGSSLSDIGRSSIQNLNTEQIFRQMKGFIRKYSIKFSDEVKDKESRGRVMAKIVEMTNLYHESVKSLLEGQREVVRDENFTFEDGITVKEKMDKFENFVKAKMPKFSLKHKLKIPGQENNIQVLQGRKQLYNFYFDQFQRIFICL